MAGLRFETFSPTGDTEVSTSQETAKLVAKAYRDGHAKGFVQGAEESAREHADAQDQLRGQLIEALKDSEMGRQAAQTSVIASMLPLVDAMVAALAPRLAEVGFHDALTDRLRTALEGRPTANPVVHCAPETAAAVEAALSDWSGTHEVVTDNRLTPLEARVQWDDGFDHVDLDSCLSDMKQSLERFRQTVTDDHHEDLSDVG